MSRYFFHLSIGPAYIHDYEGVELANEGAVRKRAVEDIMAVWKADAVKRQHPAQCVVVVSNTYGELFRVPFVEAPGVIWK